MAASADALLFQAKGDSLSYPVKAATTLYKGSMVSVVDGYAQALTDGTRFNGHAVAQANNSAGSAGDIDVQVYAGRYMLEVTLAGLTVDMVGMYVYAVDDNTYTIVPMETPLGKIVQYVSSTKAVVEFDTNICRENMGQGVMGLFEPFRLAPYAPAAATLGGQWIGTVVDGDGDAAHLLQTINASRGKAYCNGLFITTNDKENDGLTLQLNGEPFLLDDVDKVCVFGAKVMLGDATQTDLIMGLNITDTTLGAGTTDGITWRKADGSTDTKLYVEKDSTETASAASEHTMVDATAVTLGFLYNGTNVVPYVNGVAGTGLAITNLPDDENLTPSIEYLSGEAAAQTLTVYFMDSYQIVG